jgi:hypothetical protein
MGRKSGEEDGAGGMDRGSYASTALTSYRLSESYTSKGMGAVGDTTGTTNRREALSVLVSPSKGA